MTILMILAELPELINEVSAGRLFVINSLSQERRTSSVPELITSPISEIVTPSSSITASKREYEFGKRKTTKSHPSITKGRKLLPVFGCFFTLNRTPSERIRALRWISSFVIFLFSVVVNFIGTYFG